MAGLPKRQTSKSKTRSRKSHYKATKKNLVKSKTTNAMVPQGVVCDDNPTHKGITVIETKK